jgi:hypothetical protein
MPCHVAALQLQVLQQGLACQYTWLEAKLTAVGRLQLQICEALCA